MMIECQAVHDDVMTISVQGNDVTAFCTGYFKGSVRFSKWLLPK